MWLFSLWNDFAILTQPGAIIALAREFLFFPALLFPPVGEKNLSCLSRVKELFVLSLPLFTLHFSLSTHTAGGAPAYQAAAAITASATKLIEILLMMF